MRLKIISDGTPPGTRIVNAETGEEVQNVVGITWSLNVDNLSQAVVTLDYIPVELEGEVNG